MYSALCTTESVEYAVDTHIYVHHDELLMYFQRDLTCGYVVWYTILLCVR